MTSIDLAVQAIVRRAEERYRAHRDQVFRATDRLFGALMACQWVFGIVVALKLSPYAWEGKVRTVHVHVWTAVILGGILLPLKDMHQSVRLLCYIMPSRWAFEGMLLVESDARPVVPMPVIPGSPQEKPDFAEAYFPTKDDFRLGVPASLVGLGVLLVVLVVSIHLILRTRDIH